MRDGCDTAPLDESAQLLDIQRLPLRLENTNGLSLSARAASRTRLTAATKPVACSLIPYSQIAPGSALKRPVAAL